MYFRREWMPFLILGLLASVSDFSQAEDTATPFGECQLGQWTSNRNLDDKDNITKASCFLYWKPLVAQSTRLHLSVQGGVNDTGAAAQGGFRMREAFLETGDAQWNLRAGRQIISWGRADRLNPSDSFGRRDYTLLVSEDDDQKMGVDALLSNYQIKEGMSLTSVFVPHFLGNDLPVGALPSNLRVVNPGNFKEYGVKLDQAGASLDWSLSYYQGYKHTPRYWTEFLSPSAFVFRRDYEKKQTLGADMATTINDWGMRIEMAHSQYEKICRTCLARNEFSLVAGVDRDFSESANINLQLYAIRRSGFVESSVLGGMQSTLNDALHSLNQEYGGNEYGATVRIADRFLNDRLKTELSIVYDIHRRSGLIKPRLSYSMNDQYRLTLGVDHFFGHAQTYFGALKKNQLGFIEVARVF
jgi:hypothetical protein